MSASRDQSREVRHVDQVERANFVRDLAHAGKLDSARISAAAANDQFGMFPFRELFQIAVIDGLGFLGHAIRNDAISLAGKIQMKTMSKMPAVCQVQTENCVSRLNDSRVGFHVRLRTGM